MSNRLLSLALGLGVVAAYVVIVQSGNWLCGSHPCASVLWPAAGLGAAALFFWGTRLWPAVLVGAWLSGVIQLAGPGVPVWKALAGASAVALGETAQVLALVKLTVRYANGRNAFRRPHTVLYFAGISLACATLSPTAALGAFAVLGLNPGDTELAWWVSWWMGDAVGVGILVPLLVIWGSAPPSDLTLRRAGELVVSLFVLILVWEGISHGWLIGQSHMLKLTFLVIPVLLWVALRFGEHGASVGAFALACLAQTEVARGHGPFFLPDPHVAFLTVQSFIGVMGIMACTLGADIAGRKRTAQEILRLNTELEARVRERTMQLEAINKELEAFSYSVSHDLRAPLRSVRGFSEALLDQYHSRLDARGQEFLRRAADSCGHMERLIEDLLKLSRVGRSELQPGRVNLSALAQSVAAELALANPGQKVRFSAMPNLYATGDERLLRVAFDNLLSNAWKFTTRHPSPQVEFGFTRKPEVAYFVRDNGAGFDMRYADKLFRVFQRLHTTSEFPGTGVGLATVQRIVNRHGGRAWAEGAVDKGATFYFTLPA